VHLRDVQLEDVRHYVRMRCDPVMMAELGGPRPREGIEAKVRCDVEDVTSGRAWISMIVPDEADPGTVAGSVVLWSHNEHGEPISEIGWMVLPEFQGHGLGKGAVRALLERARDENGWGIVHAFPGVTNAASNGICRTLSFNLIGERDVDFAGRMFHTNHWLIDPRADLPSPAWRGDATADQHASDL
jgi:RimJ/RimL family protein N-acetyltransferase